MNLQVTRKTYYVLGILAVACSMFNAFFLVAGMAPTALADNLAFVLAGIMFLFLAAAPGGDGRAKARYFMCFVLLLVGQTVAISTPVNRLLVAACWVVFMAYENGRTQGAVRAPLLAVAACECLHTVLCALAVGGNTGLQLAYNLVFLPCTIARGWGMMALYQYEKKAAE